MKITKKDFKDLVFLNSLIRRWEIRPPKLLRLAFPGTIWRMPVNEKSIYLTFDDGPVPDITSWVLDCLKEHGEVATFFCVGDNIGKHPQVFKQLQDSGMGIGNHTYSHKRAWQCKKDDFFKDVNRFQEFFTTNLFRPPHGQLFPWWVKTLKKKYSKIIMWDILSKDYDPSLSPDDVYNNVMDHLRSGSIIVFHDSVKSWARIKEALPRVLVEIRKKGYRTKLFNA